MWLPMLLSLGIAYFFKNLSIFYLLIICGGIATLLLLARKIGYFLPIIAMISVGYTASYMRLRTMQQPQIEQKEAVILFGTIDAMDRRPHDTRLYLTNLKLKSTQIAPKKIRINTKDRHRDSLRIGDRIRVRAELMPLPLPTYPDSFDIQRFFYFKGIGGIGYTVGRVKVVQRAADR